jgi:hypothetical protein
MGNSSCILDNKLKSIALVFGKTSSFMKSTEILLMKKLDNLMLVLKILFLS